VQIRVLGSAAGGGFPQWNCNCPNCKPARLAKIRQTQSSLAVSADGTRWLLLNASPDLATQLASFALLSPPAHTLRGSPVKAVILTDGEMDHVTGLLSLREERSLRLICTSAVKNLLTASFPVLPALARYGRIRHSGFPARLAGIRVSALALPVEKAPPYARRPARTGDVVALRLEDGGRSFVYLPALPAIGRAVNKFVEGCDCLMVDGTFWSGREMIELGLSRRSARQMGHLPVSGPGGSLEWLRGLDVRRKIYTHINNTNPILKKHSHQRRMVEQAGVEISHDGMDIRL
jgi:pyrroloquinoline quinone biosynthesis protein B